MDGWRKRRWRSLSAVASQQRTSQTGSILAANHSGDSDSTAAITGNVLGVLFGEGAIPTAWLNNLERGHEIAQLADSHAITIGALRAETIWDRYPGS